LAFHDAPDAVEIETPLAFDLVGINFAFAQNKVSGDENSQAEAGQRQVMLPIFEKLFQCESKLPD
jgi:hypothetical protein